MSEIILNDDWCGLDALSNHVVFDSADSFGKAARYLSGLPCNFKVDAREACPKPEPIRGTIKLRESMPTFADHDAVSGSVMLVEYDETAFFAEIEWTDWDEIEFTQVLNDGERRSNKCQD